MSASIQKSPMVLMTDNWTVAGGILSSGTASLILYPKVQDGLDREILDLAIDH